MRAFSFARRIRVLGMSRGSPPRYAQMAGGLGFAVKLNDETPWLMLPVTIPPPDFIRQGHGTWTLRLSDHHRQSFLLRVYAALSGDYAEVCSNFSVLLTQPISQMQRRSSMLTTKISQQGGHDRALSDLL